MLTEQRREMILKLLEKNGSVTVTELKEVLNTSESTVRRDITSLDQAGKLTKVFGGAVAAGNRITTLEYSITQKNDLYVKEKEKIGKYAAALIEAEDFVYLDAGTTTARMIDYMEETKAVFVTNAMEHARKLAAGGRKVFLIGGELKASTEAIVGVQAMQALRSYHFTKGFFGTNGVSEESGCTTPDVNEALVKQAAMEQCQESYILCDHSKFAQTSAVTFAPFYGLVFITDKKTGEFERYEHIIEG